jgi:3-oxoacyl-[acyl-carrier protein] reductase
MTNKNFNLQNYEAGAASVPLKRLGEPEDIAAAICCLASGEADYVTGINLPVEGGLAIQ